MVRACRMPLYTWLLSISVFPAVFFMGRGRLAPFFGGEDGIHKIYVCLSRHDPPKQNNFSVWTNDFGTRRVTA